VGTASTKSRAGKQKGWQAKTSRDTETQSGLAGSTTADAGGEISRRAWRIAYASVMLVAAFVRLYQLELRPMHHDEGVNGFFLNNLIRTGVFRYDPTNYHGPTLYYFTLPLATVAERLNVYGTWTVRLLPLIFGLATVWLALGLRRYIGRIGALAAGALLALSPGVVFFSRYFIHEMMFVFFTLGIVVAALRFYEYDAPPDSLNASPGAPLGSGIAAASVALVAASLGAAYWPKYYVPALALVLLSSGALFVLLRRYDGERSTYLMLAAISAALLFATKETAFISVGVLLIAWAMAWGYTWFAARLGWFGAPEPASGRRARGMPGGRGGAGVAAEVDTQGLVARLGGWSRILVLLVAALGLFLFVNIVFYSSFFSNSKGVWDAVEAYQVWKKTGESGFHGYARHKYLEWLLASNKYLEWLVRGGTGVAPKYDWESGEEPMLFLLACAGALVALRETRRRFPLFAALWGFGLLAAYSLIKYKTPWLVLSMLVPFAITGGYAIDWLYRRRARALALGALGVALAVAAYQTVQLNYVHYDDDRYIYVYAHTKREYLDMIREINRIAERAGTGYETSINVSAPEYWPMPWYLRDYKRVGYQSRVIPTATDALIIASTAQSAEMQTAHGANYRLVGTYPMRPGVTLNLYARRDLASR